MNWRAGEVVDQRVSLRVDPALPSLHTLPRLHTCAPLSGSTAAPLEMPTRVDVLSSAPEFDRMPEGPIHLAILLDNDRLPDMEGWSEKVTSARVQWVSVASITDRMLKAEQLERLLPPLRETFPGAEIGFGSAYYFTELNRFGPRQNPGYDFVYFGNSALVHAEDTVSIIRTAGGQAATIRTARQLYPDTAIWVSPLTYYPRFNPNRTDGRQTYGYAHPPFSQQHGAFTAGWTLRCLLHLAEAGCRVVEAFESGGPRGLVDAGGRLNSTGQLLQWLRDQDIRRIGRLSSPEDVTQTLVHCQSPTAAFRVRASHREPYELTIEPG